MKLVNSQGRAIGARHAWHYAFESGVTSIDIRDVLNACGVQFTAKGSDNCTMDHCDKGKIQQVIFSIRTRNRFAWAWGMWSYAPEGTENQKLLTSLLLPFAFEAVRSEKCNPFLSVEYGRLAYAAMHDAAIEARTGVRFRRKRVEMGAMLGCDEEVYKKKWAPIFFRMKDALKDLDQIALPPIADVIWMLIDKNSEDPNVRRDATEDLQRAMKTPMEVA
jgi:hypothetical protein